VELGDYYLKRRGRHSGPFGRFSLIQGAVRWEST